ncbi:aminodeoxychorismate/anthranilate synthase component II [Streptococcus downei]|uniref:Para-aminobenzoate/anthranilate synthase glutamine amidotransferase component II n=1 Tax=Streptococcus downei MFe28 TaxID=764290 RepID=A0A380JHM5_STRDO|nr:aminodeoxychorismate/anthranilate synthase component II [Streptococcus downei]EFQ57922.1 glutamine amidotransferase, class I [Streptococcus downei F0415]SUN37046.1 para-aminobenzoate/anthranilate synthase glutamine amidotransferase component II [Streptococcus downei MFe28]
MILLVDNYDSFTYNLLQYLGSFSQVQVVRNDAPNLFELAQKADALVLSPGPGWPAEAGQMEDLIKDFASQKPILGICLGHQAIAESFGGRLDLAKRVMHGKQSCLDLASPSPIFRGLENGIEVMRYHSIVVEDLSQEFQVTARSKDDQEIMAIQHRQLPIFGLQFHPESIGSPSGLKMLENFVKLVKERV